MPTQPVCTLHSKHFVLVLAYTLAVALFAAIGIHAQQLQQGISVQMAVTTHALPVPAADDEDAWVIAITADGRLYFGTKQLTREGLTEQMKATPRRREQNLYIKADARAPYADVQKVLEAAKQDLFDAPVLLTVQHEQVPPGVLVPPKGLEVLLTEPAPGSEAAVVRIRGTGNEPPTVEVNSRPIARGKLEASLSARLQNQSEKFVLLKADVQLPFAQLAEVIDTCRAAGAKVILPPPEL
jgi:biopolymer transport protein ExbD